MGPNKYPSNKVSGAAFEAQKAAFLHNARLKNYSPLTIRQIDLSLRLFIEFARSQGADEAGQVDGAMVERYKTHMSNFIARSGKPLTVNTAGDRLYQVQAWFAFMKKRGLVHFNPAAEVALPRRAKSLPRGVLRPDEVEKVMSLPNLKTPIGYRDRTMMELLYASGARAAELTGIRIGDLDLKKKVVKVLGKGNKQRFVPLTTPCCRFLERYLADIRPRLIEDIRPAGHNWLKFAGTAGDLLFVSVYGGPVKPGWLGTLMKRYLFLAGVNRPISPVHGFRHTVATHLIGDGMDVRYVQAMLGHNCINSTHIYTHVERESMGKMVKAYHPLEVDRRPVRPFKEEAHADAH